MESVKPGFSYFALCSYSFKFNYKKFLISGEGRRKASGEWRVNSLFGELTRIFASRLNEPGFEVM